MLETKSRVETKETAVAHFKNLEFGQTMSVDINYVSPSQTDDGRRNESPEPISVYHEKGKLIIDQGNHRFYTQKQNGEESILIKKVKNPNTDW